MSEKTKAVDALEKAEHIFEFYAEQLGKLNKNPDDYLWYSACSTEDHYFGESANGNKWCIVLVLFRKLQSWNSFVIAL